MKTAISLAAPAELETESLVVVVLDHADPTPNEPASKPQDKKPQLKVATSDAAVQSVAADLLASGEVAGKPFETNLMHKPAGLKAKRLLLVSGGSAKKFSSYDLRRIAGTAVRALEVARDQELCLRCSIGHFGGRGSARDRGRRARGEFRP